MRRFSSVFLDRGGHVGLPAVVEQLLVDVVADGFALYCCGPKATPHALVACYEWDDCVDLLTIHDFDRVTAARVPAQTRVDIFAPQAVVWAYEGPPQLALPALLGLVHPAHPDAPTVEYPTPASLHVPRAEQRPMTIRLPSPCKAKVRAARLATAMPRLRREQPPFLDRRLVVGRASDPRRSAPGGQSAPEVRHALEDRDPRITLP